MTFRGALPRDLYGIPLNWQIEEKPSERLSLLNWLTVLAPATIVVILSTIFLWSTPYYYIAIAFTVVTAGGFLRRQKAKLEEWLFAIMVQIGPSHENNGLPPLQVSQWADPEWRGWMWEFREWEALPSIRVHQYLQHLGLDPTSSMHFIEELESIMHDL